MTSIEEFAQTCYDESKRRGWAIREVVEELMPRGGAKVVRQMAVEYMVGEVASAQRQATLNVERAAEKRVCVNSEADAAEFRERYWDGLASLHAGLVTQLNAYVSTLKVEWTQELLASSFALRDGRMVTWGEATLDAHRERHDMFMSNAQSNMEGAARHAAALRDLESTGASCLNQLAMTAA